MILFPCNKLETTFLFLYLKKKGKKILKYLRAESIFSGKSCPFTTFLSRNSRGINRRNIETQKLFHILQSKETEDKKRRTGEAGSHTVFSGALSVSGPCPDLLSCSANTLALLIVLEPHLYLTVLPSQLKLCPL